MSSAAVCEKIMAISGPQRAVTNAQCSHAAAHSMVASEVPRTRGDSHSSQASAQKIKTPIQMLVAATASHNVRKNVPEDVEDAQRCTADLRSPSYLVETFDVETHTAELPPVGSQMIAPHSGPEPVAASAQQSSSAAVKTSRPVTEPQLAAAGSQSLQTCAPTPALVAESQTLVATSQSSHPSPQRTVIDAPAMSPIVHAQVQQSKAALDSQIARAIQDPLGQVHRPSSTAQTPLAKVLAAARLRRFRKTEASAMNVGVARPQSSKPSGQGLQARVERQLATRGSQNSHARAQSAPVPTPPAPTPAAPTPAAPTPLVPTPPASTLPTSTAPASTPPASTPAEKLQRALARVRRSQHPSQRKKSLTTSQLTEAFEMLAADVSSPEELN